MTPALESDGQAQLTDLDYEATQGPQVNREQGGRHMVRSTSKGDVIQMHSLGDRPDVFWRVEHLGFARLSGILEPDNAGNMPHEEPMDV